MNILIEFDNLLTAMAGIVDIVTPVCKDVVGVAVDVDPRFPTNTVEGSWREVKWPLDL